MAKAFRSVGFLLFALAPSALPLLGCAQAAGTVLEQAPPSAAPGVVIASVVTHDAKVSILGGGGEGLRVLVRKLDGTLVADGITLEQLRAQEPALHELVTSAYASNGRGYVDATLGATN